MSVQSYLIISWGVFLLLALCSYFQVAWVVSIHYHPNSPIADRYRAYSKVHIIALTTTFLVGLFILIFRESLSANIIRNILVIVYGTIVIFLIWKIRKIGEDRREYFIQYIGNTPYRIPRNFTVIGNNKAGLRIDICLFNMKGIYEVNSRNCSYTTVIVSQKKFSDFFSSSYYFKNSQGCSLSGNRLSYELNIDRFRIEGYKNLYAIEPNKVYFQLDDLGNLLRFSQRINYRAWEHIVRRNIGIINYYEYEIEQFDLEKLLEKEKQLEDLIYSWQLSPLNPD